MRRLLSLLLLFSCISVGVAEELPAIPESGRKLISLDFRDTMLSTVLDVMSLKTGRTFVADGELAKKRITLTLKDVSPNEALNVLMDMYELYYVRQANTNIHVIKSKTGDAVTTVSKVFFLNYSTAKGLEDAFKSKLTKSGSINAEERTNSLIVTDTADNIEKLESLIKIIDVPTPQVVLEAKIVDVKLTSDMKVGAQIANLNRQMYYNDPLSEARYNYYVAHGADEVFELTKPNINDIVMPQVGYTQNLAHGLSNSGKLNVSILPNDYNIKAVLEALKTDTNAKLLSSPRLMVMNNQEAELEIVDELPYQERTISEGGKEQISVKFKDVGVKLKVRPQINGDGSIVLMVAPEQSFKIGEESSSHAPIVNASRTSTTFIIKNNETAVIGGLIRETDSKTESKVPLLGEIPILGFLFKQHSTEKLRHELTIFITARIVQ